jgi:hypothetical protein
LGFGWPCCCAAAGAIIDAKAILQAADKAIAASNVRSLAVTSNGFLGVDDRDWRGAGGRHLDDRASQPGRRLRIAHEPLAPPLRRKPPANMADNSRATKGGQMTRYRHVRGAILKKRPEWLYSWLLGQ